VEVLGPTLVDIAREKAGIVKAGSLVVVGETDPELVAVFLDAAGHAAARGVWVRGRDFACDGNQLAVGGRLLDLRTPGARYDDVYLPLHGAHQGDNAALAVTVAEGFFGSPLSADVVGAAFASVRVPGRLEVVGRNPFVVLDGAHNVAGARALAGALVELHPGGGIVAVVGLLQGRDPSAMLEALAAGGVRSVVACTAPSPRAVPASEIAEAGRAVGMRGVSTDSVVDALTLARAQVPDEGMLVVTGSLYVVADARALLVGSPPSSPGSLVEP
jgi:dihydrofolate synthase/folylpolyglutamate synthase